jgi:hypothetical protein
MWLRRFACGLLLAGIFCASQSDAFWQSRDSNYNISIAGPVGFQGPGDIASGAIAFYSAGRAYNAAYAAAQSPLADLVDTTTGLATCTLNVGVNGFANLSAAVCPTGAPIVSVMTFCTVTHVGCNIAKLYDQTGNGNHVVQATLANMPAFTLSAQNGLPCPAGTGATTLNLTTSGTISQAVPFTYTAVAERTGSFTTNQRIFSNMGGVLLFPNSANTVRFTSGTAVNLTAPDSAIHALLAVVSSTSPLFAVDASSNISTSSSGTTSLSGAIIYMNLTAVGTTAILSGFVCEAGIWPSDLNSTYQAMLANMRSATYGWNF